MDIFKRTIQSAKKQQKKNQDTEAERRKKREEAKRRRKANLTREHRPHVRAHLLEILPEKIRYAILNNESRVKLEVSQRTYDGTKLGILGQSIVDVGYGLIEEVLKDFGFQFVRSEPWDGMAPGRNFYMRWPQSWENTDNNTDTEART